MTPFKDYETRLANNRESYKRRAAKRRAASWAEVKCLGCQKPLMKFWPEAPIDWWKRKRCPACQKKFTLGNQRRLQAEYAKRLKSEKRKSSRPDMSGSPQPRQHPNKFPEWLGVEKKAITHADIQRMSPEQIIREFNRGLIYIHGTI